MVGAELFRDIEVLELVILTVEIAKLGDQGWKPKHKASNELEIQIGEHRGSFILFKNFSRIDFENIALRQEIRQYKNLTELN